MAAIRGSNTKPEMQLRKAFHAAGLRYRLHVKELPGRPDLAFPRHRAVIFVHGCFWHKHDCHLFRWPATREDFWRTKIGRNIENDERVADELLTHGWRVGTVWECALKGRARANFPDAMQRLINWLHSEDKVITVRGQ